MGVLMSAVGAFQDKILSLFVYKEVPIFSFVNVCSMKIFSVGTAAVGVVHVTTDVLPLFFKFIKYAKIVAATG